MRWIMFGAVNAASSLAAAFTSSSLVRGVAVLLAVGSAFALVVLGARSDRRVEEAHVKLLHLADEVAQTAMAANSAHLLASWPVLDRKQQEEYELFVKPIDDAVKRALGAVRGLLTGRSATRSED